jgi:AcrR family transcriptional regulator
LLSVHSHGATETTVSVTLHVLPNSPPANSPRRAELTESAYRYAIENGLADLSLRPLATAIGSSPRVLLFLFGSKDGLVRALLARGRADELELLGQLRADDQAGIAETAAAVWAWLSAEEHRGLLVLWVESYGRSLVEPAGPWGGFARETVDDWLRLLARAQPAAVRNTAAGRSERTLLLSILRGALLDLLATGDRDRVSRAVRSALERL